MNPSLWARKHLKMNLKRDYAALMLLDSRRRRLIGGDVADTALDLQPQQDDKQGAIAVQQVHRDGASMLLPFAAQT